MSSTYDMDEQPLGEEELKSARRDAEEVAQTWKTRAFYSALAFLLSCASVYPFLRGHSLHAQWNSLGKYLVLLSMGLLIPFVICMGIAVSSWMHLRQLEKTGA